MVPKVQSAGSRAEIEQALLDSAARHQFGLLTVPDLRETTQKKGIDLTMECRIVEVCNPAQAKKALGANGDVPAALPCQISVDGTEGRYTIATLLPTNLTQLFDPPALGPVAQDVEAVNPAMMDAAAGAAR